MTREDHHATELDRFMAGQSPAINETASTGLDHSLIADILQQTKSESDRLGYFDQVWHWLFQRFEGTELLEPDQLEGVSRFFRDHGEMLAYTVMIALTAGLIILVVLLVKEIAAGSGSGYRRRQSRLGESADPVDRVALTGLQGREKLGAAYRNFLLDLEEKLAVNHLDARTSLELYHQLQSTPSLVGIANDFRRFFPGADQLIYGSADQGQDVEKLLVELSFLHERLRERPIV